MAAVDPARETVAVENPATGEVVATLQATSAGDVGAMVERARAAQPGWEAIGVAGRATVLRRAQQWVADRQDEIARTIVAETGKAYEDALAVEVGYAALTLGHWARHAAGHLADERVRSTSPVVLGRRMMVRYRPLGVVGVIGPWNYPLVNCFGDAVPALAAGNAVVLKPSHETPLTSLLMLECLRECGLPEDVFQVVTGSGGTGAALVEHVDMIMFTGSTETGRRVYEAAARRLIPVSLELGGKDPMIVLADADVERAARAAVYYGLQNGGQTCIAVERVYVEAPVYDEFVDKVTRKVGALRQGVPAGPGSVDIGAMTTRAQLDVVERHVEAARAAGARVLAGGRARKAAGSFYEPTVLVDVDHDMECMREETFGPTLPIMKVADAEEAIRLANDSPYGLGASVWTRDTARGEALAARMESGYVCVNDANVNYFAPELPMGGWKASGLGSRHGADGIRKYCRRQAVLVARAVPRRELYWFPYRARTTGLIARGLRLLYGRGRRD
jgi:acyl-CoA reductase-like NAD-dependent aldehyde dehydrogenase